jgi:hypothetical protein
MAIPVFFSFSRNTTTNSVELWGPLCRLWWRRVVPNGRMRTLALSRHTSNPGHNDVD